MEEKKAGRPSKYNKDLALKVCEEIATTSNSLRTVSEHQKVSVSTVMKWIRENSKVDVDDDNEEGFTILYARAKEEQADYMIEEMIEICDDGRNDFMTQNRGGEDVEVENKEAINRSRLRIDTRKWLAAKLRPKKYGDKLDLTTTIQALPPTLPPIDLNATNDNSSEDTDPQ